MLNGPYPTRFLATAACGWSMGSYDEHVAQNAARVHREMLDPGCTVEVKPC